MFGLLNLSFWGYVIAGLILTQFTIAGVTLYLHRCQSHKALDLHPAICHIFRFWLWMSTGMVTREWVAIHRKHHANTDKQGDPHSPHVDGIRKVLWQGAELYRAASKDKAMIEKYAHGTPNDWLENRLYGRFPVLGVSLLLIVYLMLFGLPGISLWGLQMLWIPFHAAGVINGLGHYVGYRNFECQDAATNLIPWGFWIGGEELHNNHHTFASSAKFSVHWWEFDIGWLYIRILSALGLAKVRKLPAKLIRIQEKSYIDMDTVRAVVGQRFQILSLYYKTVIKPVVREKKRALSQSKQSLQLFKGTRVALKYREEQLSERRKMRLQTLMAQFDELARVIQFRRSLQATWQKAASSQQELVEALQVWCVEAKKSGITTLVAFAEELPRLSLKAS